MPQPSKSADAPAYTQDLGWVRYLLGLAVVSIPAIVLEETNERLAWRYVGLVLLMLVIWHYRGLQRFSAYMLTELQGVTK